MDTLTKKLTIKQLMDKFFETYSIDDMAKSNDLTTLYNRLYQFKSEAGVNKVFEPKEISTQLLIEKYILNV